MHLSVVSDDELQCVFLTDSECPEDVDSDYLFGDALAFETDSIIGLEVVN
jgi:hypothetical protein